MRLAMLLLLAALALGIVPAQAGRAGGAHPTLVVAIDPGHGGKDQGAVGPGRTQEKDVALQIARRLQRLANSQPGMRAVLTRSGDQFLHLYERIAVARRHHADLFISIHADAVTNPDSRGSSVFALSTRGASSAAAHWLARRENDADAVGAAWLDAKDAALRAIVFDIYHDAVMAESMALAEQVLGQLRAMCPLHTGGVERAGFAVLKAPDVPSILVETGFISNAVEEAKLRSAQQQQQLAEAIVRGIRSYARQGGASDRRVAVAVSTATAPTAAREDLGRAAQRRSRQQDKVSVAKPSRTVTATAPAMPSRTTARPTLESGRQDVKKALAKPAVATASKPLSRPASRLVVTSSSRPAAQSKSDRSAQPARIHVIKPGESLATIAQRYKVKLSDLRSANGLTGRRTQPQVGVALTIPAGDDSRSL